MGATYVRRVSREGFYTTQDATVHWFLGCICFFSRVLCFWVFSELADDGDDGDAAEKFWRNFGVAAAVIKLTWSL